MNFGGNEMKKMMIMLLLMGLVLVNGNYAYAEEVEKPEIIGQYGVVINAENGEILFEKNANEKSYPASITKIMTAMLLDEYAEDGEMIEVSENARVQECSCFVFEEGESISKIDAMNALMIVSANDLAMAIAEHISGSQEEFGKLMTKKAHELGAINTTFTTPSGLTEPDHQTTAYDMALITKEAMQHENVLHAMSLAKAVVQTDRREKEVVNTGKVHTNPSVIGGKTGYTSAAGHTLVEIFEEDEKQVIAVVMKSEKEGKYEDLEKMAHYAFSLIDSKKVVSKGDRIDTVDINGENVALIAKEDYFLTYKTTKADTIEVKTETKKNIKTIKKNEQLGTMNVFYEGELVKKIPLLASKDVLPVEKSSYNWTYVGIIVAISFVIYLLYVIQYNKRKQKKHRA